MIEDQGQQEDHDHVDGRFDNELHLLRQRQQNGVDPDVDVFLLGQMAAQSTQPHKQKTAGLIRPGGGRADLSGQCLPEKGEQNDVEQNHRNKLLQLFHRVNHVGRRFDSVFAIFHIKHSQKR